MPKNFSLITSKASKEANSFAQNHLRIPILYKLITNIMQWWGYQFTHKCTNLLLSNMFFSQFYFAFILITSNTNTDIINAKTHLIFFIH